VVHCFYNSEKAYAFIEMATADDASTCLEHLDGVTIADKEVKISRPQDYHHPSGMVAGMGLVAPVNSFVSPPSFPAPAAPPGINPLFQLQWQQQQQQSLLQACQFSKVLYIVT
jgi:RNA recognition motif-containing protein